MHVFCVLVWCSYIIFGDSWHSFTRIRYTHMSKYIVWINFWIWLSLKVNPLTLEQSYDCLSASQITFEKWMSSLRTRLCLMMLNRAANYPRQGNEFVKHSLLMDGKPGLPRDQVECQGNTRGLGWNLTKQNHMKTQQTRVLCIILAIYFIHSFSYLY